jgi:hypothetical protein
MLFGYLFVSVHSGSGKSSWAIVDIHKRQRLRLVLGRRLPFTRFAGLNGGMKLPYKELVFHLLRLGELRKYLNGVVWHSSRAICISLESQYKALPCKHSNSDIKPTKLSSPLFQLSKEIMQSQYL